jgi:hypothetical protein
MQRHRRLDLRDVGIDRKDIHEARIIRDAEVAEPVTARLSTPAKPSSFGPRVTWSGRYPPSRRKRLTLRRGQEGD